MIIQYVKIDAMAYLYEDCAQYLDDFYNKLQIALNQNINYKHMIDIEKMNDGIHVYSEIHNEVEWEVDDYGSLQGYGHYNGLLDRTDFILDLNKFIKSIDTDNVFCELEDNSYFGDF